MGRKAKFDEGVIVKKGPGRKAKKQKPPTLNTRGVDKSGDEKKLSRKQKLRLKKRLKKQELAKEKKQLNRKPLGLKQKKKKTYNSDSDDEDKQEKTKKTVKGFSDDNSDWLKPKSQGKKRKLEHIQDTRDDEDDSESDKFKTLSDTSEEEIDDYGEGSESEEEKKSEEDDAESDSEEDLPIEKESKALKVQMKKQAKLAEEELQLNIGNQEIFQFPSNEEENAITNLQEIQQRMKDVIAVLSDFNRLRDEQHSRSDYLDLLKKDLCSYYSYNDFFMEKLIQLFPLNELLEFLEASEVQRPLTIRTNSLKTRRRDLAQALINRGVNLDPIGKWSKVGLVVYSSQLAIGATLEYLAGHYIVQGASSLLPVMALAPQENERILDMCSAPGGKASHIAAVMKNTGVLFANDANSDRIKAVVGNFHRLGVVNAVVSSLDGRKYPDVMKGFDRVLLDAPCTGSGVISKNPSVKTTKDEIDVQRCFTLQRELLLAAIDCVNAKSSTGGYIVYSTCSIFAEENEAVVDFALKKRNVKLVDTGLEFGSEGFTNFRQYRFHPTLKLSRRFYPHSHNMEGFFVAKLKKFSNAIPITKDTEETVDMGDEVVKSNDGKKQHKNEVKITNGHSSKGKTSQKEKKTIEKQKSKNQSPKVEKNLVVKGKKDIIANKKQKVMVQSKNNEDVRDGKSEKVRKSVSPKMKTQKKLSLSPQKSAVKSKEVSSSKKMDPDLNVKPIKEKKSKKSKVTLNENTRREWDQIPMEASLKLNKKVKKTEKKKMIGQMKKTKLGSTKTKK